MKDYGRNALIEAVIDNDYQKVLEVINNEIDINHQDNLGWSALHYACQNISDNIVELLLSNGSTPNLKDNNGNTPISTAVFSIQNKDSKVIPLLLSSGADPTIKNNNEVNAIELAKMISNYDLMHFFSEYI